MKLLFIFTGGTIGSRVSGDYIVTDENKPYELIEKYREIFGIAHSLDMIMPYEELSEQNTGVTVSKLIACVYDAVMGEGDKSKKAEYDGIIVMHGTDTLPYSAAALSYSLGNACVPICMVSSNYPISDDRANGLYNLHGAIRLMESGNAHRGVFVSYRNHDGVIYIHRASRLLETAAFSDEYYSVRNEYYGTIVNDTFQKNELYKESDDKQDPIGKVELNNICDRIARYHVYPGMSFNVDESVECLLLESFHSGTINTKLSDYRHFYNTMYKRDVSVYLTGIRKGLSYESTSLYERLNILPIYDIAPTACYMKLWMLMAAGRKQSADILNLPLGGDV